METRAVKKSVIINAKAADVWDAITNPESIKQYFFGTTVETDWKEGSDIIYSGIWKGREYHDKGKIISIEKNKRLEHTHWSSLSGLSDEPNHYYTVIYELEEKENNQTVISVTQAGHMSQVTYDHSASNWEMVLQKLKELVEKKVAEAQVLS